MLKQMHRPVSGQITRTFMLAWLFASCAISGLLLISSEVKAADADLDRGENLSQTCLGCHGAPGLRNPGPVYLIPMVGGQHPEYIIAALQAYKAKTRSHGTMQAQAANLSDQDMADIAAYFTSLGDNSRPSNVNQTLANKGKELSAICTACHGQTGDGENTLYPKLAGQYESYLVQALKDYRSGERENVIMAGFSNTLTIDQIKALSAWYASQSGGLSAPESTIFK
ncbi:MAG: cytochrome c4 [Acidiferrobacterales bacterium]|nr:cytochrome c4 [Acidiferrobacterales bacterium]